VNHLRPDDYLYRIFYYDTEPLRKIGHNPISQEAIKFGETSVAKAQDELFQSLRKTPNFALRLGTTQWRNNEWILYPRAFTGLIKKQITVDKLNPQDVHPRIEQKAVDMKIGLDIATIAIKKLADLLILISGDADLVPAIKFARKEGMQVCLDPLRAHIQPQLAEHVDFIESKLISRR
jgi:uncharacterized LabA/DUF88 family protein